MTHLNSVLVMENDGQDVRLLDAGEVQLEEINFLHCYYMNLR